MIVRILLAVLFLSSFSTLTANEHFKYHYKTKVRKGEGVWSLMRRYKLADHSENIEAFYELNNLNENDYLRADKNYTLPVAIYSYNQESIRSTIGVDDWDLASAIARYNRDLLDSGIRTSTYQASGILWVPHHLLNLTEEITDRVKSETVKRKVVTEPLFGEKYKEVEVRSEILKDKVFYVISGHGGPDPGAFGFRMSNKLPEDEYAYDVALRLARNLMENGATVHIIIQDPNDGIRDEELIQPDGNDEVCYGGQRIPLNQVKRLAQRCNVVNALYRKYQREGKNDQRVVAIHIDSRPVRQRTDVFFYHHATSKTGRKIARNIQSVFKEKYKIHRSNGQYHGSVTSRNLFVLRETIPPAVYVELANIKNPIDQIRITQAGNRQALANWLFEGLIQ